MKRALIGLGLIIGLAAVVAVVAILQMRAWLAAPLPVPEEGLVFDVQPGAAFVGVSNDLADSGVIDRPRLFSWYGRLTGNAGRIHAGEYLIEAGTTPRSLLEKFVAGDVCTATST